MNIKSMSGADLKQIEVKPEPSTFYFNSPPNVRPVKFPYCVKIELVFADGSIEEYEGFPSKAFPTVIDWSREAEVVNRPETHFDVKAEDSIPERYTIRVDGTTYTLYSISYTVEHILYEGACGLLSTKFVGGDDVEGS